MKAQSDGLTINWIDSVWIVRFFFKLCRCFSWSVSITEWIEREQLITKAIYTSWFGIGLDYYSSEENAKKCARLANLPANEKGRERERCGCRYVMRLTNRICVEIAWFKTPLTPVALKYFSVQQMWNTKKNNVKVLITDQDKNELSIKP